LLFRRLPTGIATRFVVDSGIQKALQKGLGPVFWDGTTYLWTEYENYLRMRAASAQLN
jgi:hypothetical protein